MRTKSVKCKHSVATSFQSNLDNDTYTATTTLSPAIQAVVPQMRKVTTTPGWGAGALHCSQSIKESCLETGLQKMEAEGSNGS